MYFYWIGSKKIICKAFSAKVLLDINKGSEEWVRLNGAIAVLA